VVLRAELGGELACAVEFDGVPLAVRHAEGVEFEARGFRMSEAGGAINAAAEEDDRSLHAG